MSATPFNLTKDTCSSITISAKGRAAKRCRDYMGTFTPVPGKYSFGRQVFRSSSGKYLLVNADFHYSWTVSDSRQQPDEGSIKVPGDVMMFSGCAPGICPADPRARYNRQFNTENWTYDDCDNFVESEAEDITVSCDTHFPSALPDIDDLVSYIEGKTS